MNYNLLFPWIALMAIVARSGDVSYITEENGYEQNQVTKVFSYLVFIPIIIFVCRSTWEYWGDYYSYLRNYQNFPINLGEALIYIRAQDDSYLFYVLTYLVKVLSGGSVFVYRLVLALIQSIPFIFLFRRYSPSYVFSVFLFIATGNPIGWMLNGIRQLVAAGIIYAATPLIVERKYARVVLVVLIATLFHQTAILMLPIIFICQGEAWNWKTNLAIVGIVIVTFFFARVSGSFTDVVEMAGYNASEYVTDDGTHPLRVLVNFVPVLIAYLHRDELKEDDNPLINVLINMSIISFGIYLISMVTSGILVGRVPLYTSMFNFILLPFLFNRCYYGNTRRLLYISASMGYILYYYFLYFR